MDTPRKVGYGRGAGHLDTGAPVSSPVGRRPQLSADPVYDVPPVLAPGPLAAYEKAELLNALPPVDGDMRPSMLLDRMRALTPTDELDNPNSLFWFAFLSRLPPDIRVSCVPFVGVEMLADAQGIDAQFWARPRYATRL